jgi:hypothetical protein
MQNFIFISPNYPEGYWMFCRGLKKYGARVLAVIDTDYDSLSPMLKENIDECYRISSFHNVAEVYKAIAYFAFKYGKPDWIESNNEAWLGLDALMRDEFNVTSGYSRKQIDEFQSKSAMKSYYKKAGVATADYILPKTLEEAKDFAKKYDWNCVFKPDHGVGASDTWHIHNEDEMEKYWDQSLSLNTQMILEQYVNGEVVTLDGVADQNGRIRFIGSMEYVSNCMDSLQNHGSIGTYYTFGVDKERLQLAQRVVDAFGIKNRFFHGEYFRLNEDVENLGKKGHLIGLEMNFRPPGGFCPDLINYSFDTDIYDIWAKVLLTQENELNSTAPYSAGFVGRRKGNPYKYSVEELMHKYKTELLGVEILPPAFASAMGDVTLKARFTTPERRDEFFQDSFALDERDSLDH